MGTARGVFESLAHERCSTACVCCCVARARSRAHQERPAASRAGATREHAGADRFGRCWDHGRTGAHIAGGAVHGDFSPVQVGDLRLGMQIQTTDNVALVEVENDQLRPAASCVRGWLAFGQ